MKKGWIAILLVLIAGLTVCACENTNASDPGVNAGESGVFTEPVINKSTDPVKIETTEHRITPVSEFEYEMVNGEVIITGYSGVAREIYIPAEINERPVTQIGEQAFAKYDLISIEIPDSVLLIGENAFASCKCLENVRLPDSNLRIEMGAFYECDALTQIVLPDNLAFLGYGAFGYCDNLKYLHLPKDFTGFDIVYQQWIEWYDNGSFSNKSGEKINSPVHGDMTLLVVEWESEAHKLIREYGFGDIGYNANYSVQQNEFESEENKLYVQETMTILDSTGNVIQKITNLHNNKGVMLKTENAYFSDVTITEYTLGSTGYPIKSIDYNENGEIVGESIIECDENGNIISQKIIKNGVTVQAVQYTYNDREVLQKRIIENYNEDGSIGTTHTNEYDQDGRVVFQLTKHRDGYNKYEFEYKLDENGNPCLQKCMEEIADGDEIRHSESYTRLVCDGIGHTVFTASVGEHGSDEDRYQINEYDEYGNLVKSVSYYQGEIVLTIVYTYIEIK